MEEKLETSLENNAEKIVEKLMGEWFLALLEKDPELMSNFYKENGISFIPTFPGDSLEEKHVDTREGAKKYFEHFLAKNPQGKIVESTIDGFYGEAVIYSGLYEFEVDSPDGGRMSALASFTYHWVKDGDKWMIQHHHSAPR